MAFVSDAQRKWWFANHGPNSGSGGGAMVAALVMVRRAVVVAVVMPFQLFKPMLRQLTLMLDIALIWHRLSELQSVVSMRKRCIPVCLRQTRCGA